MRYKGKHGFLKNIVQKYKNFKNLAKTLANKVQETTVFEKYFQMTLSTGPSKECKLCEFEFYQLIVDNIEQFPDNTSIHISKWAKLGYFYKKGFMICTGMSNNSNVEMPSFERIVKIIIIFDRVFFITNKWVTNRFCKELNAFEMSYTNVTNIIDLNLLVYKEPYELHQTYSGSQLYLVPKHCFTF